MPTKRHPAGVPARGIVDCTYRHGHNGQILNQIQDDILKKCRLLVGMPFACVQEHTGRRQVLQTGVPFGGFRTGLLSSRSEPCYYFSLKRLDRIYSRKYRLQERSVPNQLYTANHLASC